MKYFEFRFEGVSVDGKSALTEFGTCTARTAAKGQRKAVNAIRQSRGKDARQMTLKYFAEVGS